MSTRYAFGLFDFDPATGELRRDGGVVRLQPQPARVLAVLLGRAGELVTRDELRTRVWPDGTYVDFERGLNVCIAQIRSALRDSAESPRFVETLPRRGYRFIAPVRPPDAPSAGKPAAASVIEDVQTMAAPPPSVTPPAARNRGLVWGASALVVLSMLGLAAAWSARDGGHAPVRVAVLPFDNETGDGRYSDLAQSVSDATVARLAAPGRVERLAVIGNSAALRRPRAFRDLKAIGADVQADFIVLAQVRRDEARTRLIAHLIRVEDEAHVWAQTFDRPEFTLEAQGEIAETIAAAVAEKLGAGTNR